MASLPPLLPTPPASINPRDTDAVESPSPKRHRPLEPDSSGSRRREPNSPPSSSPRVGRSPPSKFRRRSRSPPSPQSKVPRRSRSPPPSKVRRRSRSLSPSRVRRRSRSPPPSRVRRRSRSPPPSRARQQSRSPSRVRRRSRSPSRVRRRSRSPSPSRVRRRSRSPSRVRHRSRSPLPSRVRRRSRSPSPSRVRRRSRSPPPSRVWHRSRSPPYVSRLAELQHPKRPSAEAAVEGESASPSSSDDSSMENWPSHSHNNCEHPETSSAAMEKRPNPAIRGDGQKLYGEKMDGKNQSDDKVPSRNARRKKMKRQRRAGAKNEMGEAPSGNDRRKKMKRGIWSEAKKEFREMKRHKLFENIKKLQTCVWLLEKDGADMAEIMEFRSMLETTKKQYAENEAQLAKEGSSAPLQVLKRDRLEKMHGMAAPVEKAERDEPNMDSGKVEGSDAVSERNELAEEVNHLKSELETVRENRDYQLAQAQPLMADVAKQKEVARRYGVELEDAMRRVASLEEGCLLRREMIKALQIQLASANEKLTVPSPTRD